MARTRTRSVQTDNGARQKSVTAERERSAEQEAQRKDRPTPSANDVKARGVGSTGIINRIPVVRSLAAYFRGVVFEMQKVTWPSREDTTRLTTLVLAVTAAFSIGLGILDTFYSWWFQQAFHTDSETIFLGIAALVALAGGGVYVAFKRYV